LENGALRLDSYLWHAYLVRTLFELFLKSIDDLKDTVSFFYL